ncbi:Putative tyrosine-protein kinase YveL [Burkholderiaceae bacterium]|nr:Putative tyrosine-protein kinase YveL [Burkholderiaceae bacterium]
MSIIEQAAKRLEQLRGAGVEVPWQDGVRPTAPSTRSPSAAPLGAVSGSPSQKLAAPVSSRQVHLDLNKLAQSNLLVPNHASFALERDFRVIKQRLLANAVGPSRIPRGNLILVTSALPAEGKTFCSINLALSMAAEIDKTVLLVDADVAQPALPTRLGIEPSEGLLDILSNPEIQLPDVMVRTNIPKLALLQSGAPRTNSAELLASGEMSRLLDEVADRYADRLVVIDAPPLLATIDARILARLAGQVVMVVQAGRTRQDEVKEAFAMVEKCSVVMSVLNRRPAKLGLYRGGYGY